LLENSFGLPFWGAAGYEESRSESCRVFGGRCITWIRRENGFLEYQGPEFADTPQDFICQDLQH
jgi:hypothetical protein